MKSIRTRFFVILICLLVALIGSTLVAENAIPRFVTPYWHLLLLFFVVVNILVFFMVTKFRERNDMKKFTNFYMGTMVVKVLLYLSVIVIYAFTIKDDFVSFVLTFLAYYLCFTVFETYILVKK